MAEGEFPKSDGDILYGSEVNTFVPIGAILPWAKSITGVPSLPSNFVECNGQTLSDADSPLDGQTIPDLNGDNRFLRGNSTSGDTGGSETHTHTGTTGSSGSIGLADGNPFDVAPPNHTHTFTTDATSTLPTYYGVVYIMKIK